MSITLETVLGTIKPVDPNILAYNRVNNLQNKNTGDWVITANFVRNVWADRESDGDNAVKEGSRYVVISRPENLGQLLLNNYAKDERELASVYVMEETERVEEHNRRERQKIADWQKSEKQKIEEWESRGRAKIQEWERRERDGQQEYQFDIEMRQEDAKKAATNYIKLILDALEARNRQIGALRSHYNSQYKDKGFFFDHRIDMLKKFMEMEGVKDEDALKDIAALAKNKDYNVRDSTKAILVKQLELIIPEIIPQEQPPPYIPAPRPEPEPRPIPNPRPEINLKSLKGLPPLLDELEAVVMSPYSGQSLENLKLTQEAWNTAGISPQEVRDRITKDVIPLTDQYLLVRVVGKSEKDSGSLNLLQIISNPPKALRPYFIKPAEIVEDAYALAAVIGAQINDYFENNEHGKKIASKIPVENAPFTKRAVLEKILHSSTGLASAVFSNTYAVFDNELLEKVLEGRDPMEANAFRRRYAILINEEEKRRYQNDAENIAKDIKDRYFNSGIAIENSVEGYNVVVDDLNLVVSVIMSLEASVPEEMFKLREAKVYTAWRDLQENDIKVKSGENRLDMGMRIGFDREQAYEALWVRGATLGIYYKRQIRGSGIALGNALAKDAHKWDLDMKWEVLGNTLLKFNLGKRVEYDAATLVKP